MTELIRAVSGQFTDEEDVEQSLSWLLNHVYVWQPMLQNVLIRLYARTASQSAALLQDGCHSEARSKGSQSAALLQDPTVRPMNSFVTGCYGAWREGIGYCRQQAQLKRVGWEGVGPVGCPPTNFKWDLVHPSLCLYVYAYVWVWVKVLESLECSVSSKTCLIWFIIHTVPLYSVHWNCSKHSIFVIALNNLWFWNG